jgi:hypothetical protein
VQVAQRKHHHDLTGVFHQTFESGLGLSKDAFERVKRMLYFGAYASLSVLSFFELVFLDAFGHLFELGRA